MNPSDLYPFELLQTPIWIIDRGLVWFANKAAKGLINEQEFLAEFHKTPRSTIFFLTANDNSYQCTTSIITIENDRTASLIEANLDQRYQLLLEATPDAVIIADLKSGAIISGNTNAEYLTGKKIKELVGIQHTELYPEFQQKQADEVFRSYEREWSPDWLINRSDGTSVRVEIYSTIFGTSSQKLVYGFLRNMFLQTKKEEWNTERTIYRSLLDDMPQCILRKDIDGNFTFANNAFLNTIGISLEELIGKTDYDFYPQELADKYRQDDLNIMANQTMLTYIEAHQPPKNDEQIYVEVVKSPIIEPNGRVIGIQGIFWNVTELHHDRQKLEEREFQLNLTLSAAELTCWEYNIKSGMVKGVGTFSPIGWQMVSWEMTIGEVISSIYLPDIVFLERSTEQVLQEGGNFDLELRLADFSVLPRWFFVRGEVLLDSDHKPDRVVGITVEITQRKQAELALQANQKMLNLIMDHSPSLIWLKDKNGYFTYGNPQILDSLKISDEQFIGKTNQEIFEPQFAFVFDEIAQQILATGKSIQIELTDFLNKDRIYLLTKFPLINEISEVYAVGGVAIDVTDIKIAESALIQNQSYLNCLISIQQQLLADPDRESYQSLIAQLGKVADVSRVYIFENHLNEEEILLSSQRYEWCAPGINPEIDNPILQNVTLHDGFPRWIETLSKGEEISGVVANFPPKERQILEVQGILSILVLPLVVNQRFWGFIGFDHCQSAVEWNQSALNLLRSAATAISFHLERQENRNHLIEARQKADAANASKSRFLANMSHELRTPMNGVIGLTSLLQATNLNDEQQDYVKTIRDSGEALLSLITDVLDFSKIESDRIELEIQEFSLRTCIEEVIDLMAPQASDQGLEIIYWLESDVPEWIRSDVTRLRQILLNLVSNSVKFTPEGKILIKVSVKEHLSDAAIVLCFAIQDEGIGIEADRVQHIFNPFTQADSSITRRYGGTGLGLSICYRLTRLLGGEMEVETQVGRGSTFIFTIQAQPVDPMRTLPSLPTRHIYLSLESPLLTRMITLMLNTWQIEVSSNSTGVDLIITDRLLEGITTPSVLLLPYGGRSSHRPTLTKPVRYDDLFGALAQVFLYDLVDKSYKMNPEPELVKFPLRILVAEDNPVNQKVCLKLLEKLQYRADLVGNGLEALEAITRQTYDVVLMDLQMPEMDGLTATKEIRKRSKYTPWIIALTADAQVETERLSFECGVNDYLTKPIRLEELSLALCKAHQELNTSK